MHKNRISLNFIKRYNIALQLIILIVSITTLASYNYITQRDLFQQQLKNDTHNLVEAFRSSIKKFNSIKSTLNLQQLVRDISLGLDIFEFRYLDNKGIIVNSMFQNEIGNTFSRPGFDLSEINRSTESSLYLDTRDMTSVLAISHPVFVSGKLVGVIDMAFDISDLDFVKKEMKAILIQRMKRAIRNVLQTIAASIGNSLKVFNTVNTHDFLTNYVHNTENIIQISITDASGKVISTSDENFERVKIGMKSHLDLSKQLNQTVPFRRIITPLNPENKNGHQLLLLIDTTLYVSHERKLFITSLSTTIFIIIFALIISYSIYRINLERARLEKIKLEQKVKERTQEIERISQIDKLTGLPNRRHLDELLQQEFKRTVRFNHDVSLMVLDLDYFKRVNDTYGHLAGDAVLQKMGEIIQSEIRETDIAGRFGGEEFVVMLPESSPHIAQHVARKLCDAVRQCEFTFEKQLIPVTISIGISAYDDSVEELQILFQQADSALYAAKEKGRDRFICFEPEIKDS